MTARPMIAEGTSTESPTATMHDRSIGAVSAGRLLNLSHRGVGHGVPKKNGELDTRAVMLFLVAMYYSTGNKFERFRGFLELIRRFEFEFCRPGNFFLNDSNFWCVHVNVPWPVCAHAIPFRMLWCP